MLWDEDITFITNKQICTRNPMYRSFIENQSKKCVDSGIRKLYNFKEIILTIKLFDKLIQRLSLSFGSLAFTP